MILLKIRKVRCSYAAFFRGLFEKKIHYFDKLSKMRMWIAAVSVSLGVLLLLGQAGTPS